SSRRRHTRSDRDWVQTCALPIYPPHHRSGAALYFVISGTGANTVDGKTQARGPGSLIYEPHALVHQWGNPGNEPLIFLAFNINQIGRASCRERFINLGGTVSLKK